MASGTTAISGRLKAYFLAGVLVTAPISVTFYIAWKFISFVDAQVSPLIPPSFYPQYGTLPGFGLVAAVIGLTLVGALTANFAGRLLVSLSEALLNHMPVIRGIYGAVKQVFHTVLSSKADAFREVVVIEYPRPGVWTLGFITGATTGAVGDCFDQEMVNVFVPTTPNPTSGFLLFVPRADVRVLDMSVEDGIKMVVSTGILTPER